MVNNKYKNYLKDLGEIIKKNSLEAKQKRKIENDDYSKGRLMAYYEVISLLKQQAKAFNIDLKDIELENFDEDKNLLF